MSELTKLKIALLKGGWSAERDVSLKTGSAVASALQSLGHDVTEVDPQTPDFDVPAGTDFVFICLHGTFGEDGGVQKVLTERGLRFNGSGEEASRKAWDKWQAKQIFIDERIPTPKGELWNPDLEWPFPFVLKPVAQGSSVHVYRISNGDELAAVKQQVHSDEPMLVERAIIGREFTVSILGDEALPVIEIQPKEGFYDYTNKYTSGKTEYLCPAPISAAMETQIRELGLSAHRALGCEVYSRVDVMMNAREENFVLEVNTIPGMTELSLIPRAAKQAGMDFPQLCQRIIELSWNVERKSS